jgi:hypothetical protein
LCLAIGRVLYVIDGANETGRLLGTHVSVSDQFLMMRCPAPMDLFVAVIWGTAYAFQGALQSHTKAMGGDWREIAKQEKEEIHTVVRRAAMKASLMGAVEQYGIRV